MRFAKVAFSMLAWVGTACGSGDQSSGPAFPPDGKIVSAMPEDISFGYVTTGAPVPPTVITVTNTWRHLDALHWSLSGGQPSNLSAFQIEDDTCSGHTIDVGASCSLAVRFVPTSPGIKSGELDLTGPPGSLGAGYALLFGEATALAVDPMQVDFGAVPAGTTSPPKTFTVTASIGAAGTLARAELAPQKPGFVVSSDTCSNRSLAPGETCTFAVSFSPTTAGPVETAIQFFSTDGSSADARVQGAGQ